MVNLERHIAPDEPVLWRSPTLRDWAIGQLKLLAWSGSVPVAVAAVFQDFDMFIGSMVAPLIGLVFAAKELFVNPAEVLLTGRQLLLRRGLRRPSIRTFERRDITRLEIFGGDGTLALFGRREELCRSTLLGDPMDLARALDIPTTFWKPYEPTSRVWRVDLYLMPFVFLATFALASALVYSLPEVFWETVRDNIFDVPEIVAVPAALAILVAAGIPSALVVAVLFGGLRRLLYPRTELDRMRCYKFDPLWRGKDPAAVATGGFGAALRAARLGFDRLVYGRFPECPAIEPEQYEPGAFPPPEEDEGD